MTTIDAGLPDTFRASWGYDEDPDTSYLEQDGWEDHLESYRRGGFTYVYVLLEKLCSCCGSWSVVGSLSGIEHNHDADAVSYLVDTAKELHTEEVTP